MAARCRKKCKCLCEVKETESKWQYYLLLLWKYGGAQYAEYKNIRNA